MQATLRLRSTLENSNPDVVRAGLAVLLDQVKSSNDSVAQEKLLEEIQSHPDLRRARAELEKMRTARLSGKKGACMIVVVILVVGLGYTQYKEYKEHKELKERKRKARASREARAAREARKERKRLEALKKQQDKSVKVRFERLFNLAARLLKNPTKITQAHLVKLVSHASVLLLTMYGAGKEKLQAVWKSALAMFWKHKKAAAEVLASTVESLRNLSNGAKALISTAVAVALLKAIKKVNFKKLKEHIMFTVDSIVGQKS